MPKAKIIVRRVDPDSLERSFVITYDINRSVIYCSNFSPEANWRRYKQFITRRNKVLKSWIFKQFNRAHTVAEKLSKVKGIKKVYISEQWKIPNVSKN